MLRFHGAEAVGVGVGGVRLFEEEKEMEGFNTYLDVREKREEKQINTSMESTDTGSIHQEGRAIHRADLCCPSDSMIEFPIPTPLTFREG